MNNREEKKEILNGIYNQISAFDNKAGLLISVVGIVFALSLDFLSLFNKSTFICCELYIKIICYILFAIYILSFVSVISCLVLVIIPRENKDRTKSANYYKDIVNMSSDEYKKSLNDYINKDDTVVNQIIKNANICDRKHKWLKKGIVCLIPYAITMVIFIILILFVF